jgi:hypothetical protein
MVREVRMEARARGPRRRAPAAVLAALLLLSSCAGLQRSRDRGDARYIADLINSGKPQELTRMSAVPFLVDGEIVALPGDVAAFWQNAVKSGFRIPSPELASAEPLRADSYREFADSMEVKTFFKKYADRDARLLELESSSGQSVLLLVKDSWGARKLYGFKGPYSK